MPLKQCGIVSFGTIAQRSFICISAPTATGRGLSNVSMEQSTSWQCLQITVWVTWQAVGPSICAEFCAQTQRVLCKDSHENSAWSAGDWDAAQRREAAAPGAEEDEGELFGDFEDVETGDIPWTLPAEHYQKQQKLPSLQCSAAVAELAAPEALQYMHMAAAAVSSFQAVG